MEAIASCLKDLAENHTQNLRCCLQIHSGSQVLVVRRLALLITYGQSVSLDSLEEQVSQYLLALEYEGDKVFVQAAGVSTRGSKVVSSKLEVEVTAKSELQALQAAPSWNVSEVGRLLAKNSKVPTLVALGTSTAILTEMVDLRFAKGGLGCFVGVGQVL